MMHINNVVVVLTNSNKRPIRELNVRTGHTGTSSNRSCELVVPFDTEYKFLIKNRWSSHRVRIDVEIDGSYAFRGLVVEPMSEVYLERFQDIAKHFKFVSATNSAVSDPTNSMNGNIKVFVYRELTPVLPTYSSQHSYSNTPYKKYLGDVNNISHHVREDTVVTTRGLTGEWSGIPGSINCINTVCDSYFPDASAYIGATVEGANSYQTFKRVEWAGDDINTSVFNFYMKGRVEMGSYEKEQKLAEYHKLQQELSSAGLI